MNNENFKFRVLLLREDKYHAWSIAMEIILQGCKLKNRFVKPKDVSSSGTPFREKANESNSPKHEMLMKRQSRMGLSMRTEQKKGTLRWHIF